jgi:hypothetical protein
MVLFPSGNKLLPSDKYLMTDRQTNDYSWEMNLTIRSLEKADFVGYICSSENALGKAEGAVRLQGKYYCCYYYYYYYRVFFFSLFAIELAQKFLRKGCKFIT